MSATATVTTLLVGGDGDYQVSLGDTVYLVGRFHPASNPLHLVVTSIGRVWATATPTGQPDPDHETHFSLVTGTVRTERIPAGEVFTQARWATRDRRAVALSILKAAGFAPVVGAAHTIRETPVTALEEAAAALADHARWA